MAKLLIHPCEWWTVEQEHPLFQALRVDSTLVALVESGQASGSTTPQELKNLGVRVVCDADQQGVPHPITGVEFYIWDIDDDVGVPMAPAFSKRIFELCVEHNYVGPFPDVEASALSVVEVKKSYAVVSNGEGEDVLVRDEIAWQDP